MDQITDDAEWHEMFSIQYDLCEEIVALINDRLKGLSVVVQSTAYLYVIEQLAERGRYNIELPKLPWRREGDD
jgi:hypothetical protein